MASAHMSPSNHLYFNHIWDEKKSVKLAMCCTLNLYCLEILKGKMDHPPGKY